MAATAAPSTALVRIPSPGALTLTKPRRSTRGRKRGVMLKELGIGALGLAAGGAGTTMLHRWLKLSPEAAGIVMAVGGGVGAAVTKEGARAFFLGTAGGGATVVTAGLLGLFKEKKPEKPANDAGSSDAKQLAAGDTKQLAAGDTSSSDAAKSAATAPAPPRNASSIGDQVSWQIARALDDARRRERIPA